MFELTLSKETLLSPLMTVASAVDKKQALPILSNILINLSNNELHLTATDLEIEITAFIPCEADKAEGEITVPAKKMVDILRSLEDGSVPTISLNDAEIVKIKSGRSQFKLATLPAEHYPSRESECNEVEITLSRTAFIDLLQSTHFAIAQQEVRLFLNGLLLELDSRTITAVATDGHRMAVSKLDCHFPNLSHRFLIPRKGIQEMLKLLHNIEDEQISISGGKRHFKLSTQRYTLQSRLIEARFPVYAKAIPKGQDKTVVIERDVLKRALSRIVILAHEKSRAVVLHLQPGILTLIAHNQEQEEATEALEAQTEGDEIKIAINASYLLDVLQYLKEGLIRLSMAETNSSLLVESVDWNHYQYIIMPMKI